MNQPAIARRVVLTVIACALALSGLWLWLRLTGPSDDARVAVVAPTCNAGQSYPR